MLRGDGEKEKVYSHGIAFAISDEFDDYLVKKVSSQWIDWNAEIDIVIEPCEEMKEKEKEMKKNTIFKMGGCSLVTAFWMRSCN